MIPAVSHQPGVTLHTALFKTTYPIIVFHSKKMNFMSKILKSESGSNLMMTRCGERNNLVWEQGFRS